MIYDLFYYYQVLGIAIFAFAYVTTIPSWVNEKRPGVSVNRAVRYIMSCV